MPPRNTVSGRASPSTDPVPTPWDGHSPGKGGGGKSGGGRHPKAVKAPNENQRYTLVPFHSWNSDGLHHDLTYTLEASVPVVLFRGAAWTSSVVGRTQPGR